MLSLGACCVVWALEKGVRWGPQNTRGWLGLGKAKGCNTCRITYTKRYTKHATLHIQSAARLYALALTCHRTLFNDVNPSICWDFWHTVTSLQQNGISTSPQPFES